MAEVKAKKKAIPKVLKDLCWSKYIGNALGETSCMCCQTNMIRMNDFHCGHVIAEAKGGETVIENLRPICKKCNLSMGTDNLNEFRTRYGFDRKPSSASIASPVRASVAEASEIMIWSPGMFLGLKKMPKYIKWQPGTSSTQMGDNVQKYGYVYNKDISLYERK